jgi:hypothetical protein
MGLLVKVMYRSLTQSVFRLDRVKYISCDCLEKISVAVDSNDRAVLRLLVLVSAHTKLQNFVRICAWSILSLGANPPLAH